MPLLKGLIWPVVLLIVVPLIAAWFAYPGTHLPPGFGVFPPLFVAPPPGFGRWNWMRCWLPTACRC